MKLDFRSIICREKAHLFQYIFSNLFKNVKPCSVAYRMQCISILLQNTDKHFIIKQLHKLGKNNLI